MDDKEDLYPQLEKEIDRTVHHGHALLWVGLAILVTLLVGAGARFTYMKEALIPEHVACTEDAMQCPDGSWVGRTGPNCEFVCPDIENQVLDTSDWKTYRNEEFGFEFEYPKDWKTQDIQKGIFKRTIIWITDWNDVDINYFLVGEIEEQALEEYIKSENKRIQEIKNFQKNAQRESSFIVESPKAISFLGETAVGQTSLFRGDESIGTKDICGESVTFPDMGIFIGINYYCDDENSETAKILSTFKFIE